MKSILIVCAALGVLLSAAAQAEAQEVRVTVTGVEARGGQILASLQTEDQFMQPRGAYGIQQTAPAADGAVTLTFSNVAPGAYALSVLHDANGDYQMQRQANGRPLEGWAMSHGEAVAALHAAPSFAVASFDVAAAPVSLTEPMIYPAGQ